MRKLFYLAFTLFISSVLVAQTGKISGKVINAASGQPLANASVTLLEKSNGLAADLNGLFVFNKLATGTYSIKCTYSGHVDKIIE